MQILHNMINTGTNTRDDINKTTKQIQPISTNQRGRQLQSTQDTKICKYTLQARPYTSLLQNMKRLQNTLH